MMTVETGPPGIPPLTGMVSLGPVVSWQVVPSRTKACSTGARRMSDSDLFIPVRRCAAPQSGVASRGWLESKRGNSIGGIVRGSPYADTGARSYGERTCRAPVIPPELRLRVQCAGILGHTAVSLPSSYLCCRQVG